MAAKRRVANTDRFRDRGSHVVQRSSHDRQLSFELLETRYLLAATFDFGDAPSPYPTTLAEDGARHEAIGLTLGTTRDTEIDGTHSTAADADGSDEDGVTFGTIRVGQLDTVVQVNVQGGPGKLNAWIDFNRDGSWGGPGEQIFDNVSISTGDNALLFDVPLLATGGVTYARFRLSSAGDLGIGGGAVDGEVEDYEVSIIPLQPTGLIFFTGPNTIATAAGAQSVFAADVDGDGDMDVLSGSDPDRHGDRIAWYENDGSESFTTHTITTHTISTTADGAQSVFAADVNGDGHMDVLSASGDDDKIAWYENDGSESFTEHTISTTAAYPRSVFAADVDGDGDMDVLSASLSDDRIAWYENDGSESFTTHTINTTSNGALSVFAADVDGDGDMDVLSASYFDDKIAWYENDGSETFTQHTISTTADAAWSVFAADVNGDGHMDVLSASGDDDKIAWYENDGSENFTTRTISTAADGAKSVFAADVNGDGHMDVLSASRDDDKIAWYQNDGSETFTEHTISTAAGDAQSVFAADVDGDGDMDVLSASGDDDKIAWYENTNEFDFGDAPVPYATTFAEDGARHASIGLTLGATRDREVNGTHSAAADADGTDEDGVTFGAIMVGQLDAGVTVNVQNVSGGAKLDAWIDFDADGSWDGPGEQVFDNVSVDMGDNALLFEVPAWAANGDTYARFRLSTTGNLDIGGLATDGEVEDYQVKIVALVDFGDAPVPYPTTFTEGGAFHAAPGPRLGGTRDAEPDGIHSAAADADGADEDGVTFGAIMIGQLDAAVTVNVQNAAGQLDAWIDFNADGSWGGPGEQIFDNLDVSTGDNVLLFDVPFLATSGVTYARFRLSSAGDLGVGGSAVDGEVEDYQVSINPPRPASGEFSAHNVITEGEPTARDIFAADVDGDGDMDVLSVWWSDDKIAWYENDGSETFTEHTISTTAYEATSVFAADVDGDGDMDVLSVSWLYDAFYKIAWYKNDGSETFTEHTITTTAYYANSVFAADVDGDGDMDVLSASQYYIAWYENDGSETFTEHTITTDGSGSVFAADVDGDGDMDVLSSSWRDDRIAWYENDGSETFTEHTVSATADGASSVFAADVDGDGDMDVLSASYYDDKIAWYENDGSETFTEHTVSATADGASSVFASDVDGDGDMDVLSASARDDKIAWYENDGSETFTEHTISTGSALSARGVFAADVDGDGDMDVLSVSYNDGEIAWYENITGSDFGDAPSPYPTTFAEDGARHDPSGLMLGATRSLELDGIHSVGADAEGTEEDGVTFGTIQVGGLGAAVTVNVQGGAGKLDAWIDFNADGSWGGPGEQILDNVSVSTGDNALLFDVPSWAVDGDTYARFRLSSGGDLGVTGPSVDGEVEDYQISINPPHPASGEFKAQNVFSTAAGAQSVFAADVDGDGDMDVLSASANDNKIAWYENDGSETFTEHTITTTVYDATSVFAADVDGDGDMDVLSAGFRDGIAWYENDGSETFTTHTIFRYNTTAANWATSVFAADVDGDGDMDVLSTSYYENNIAWYENHGSETFTTHTISTTADAARSVFAADVNGDGHMDVLSASRDDDKIAWYENNGSETFTEHTISTSANGARSVFAADVDGDGDTDVLSASANDNKIAWYENDGGETFTSQTITTTADGAFSVFAADVDGDGDMDVLSASLYDDKIAWYENDGSETFTTHTITTTADWAGGVFAADVDGDGDMDVLSASFSDDTIAWYENIDAADFGDAPSPYPTTLAEDGARHEPFGLTLGATRDVETDGTHSAAADADGADEDGLTFGAIRVGAFDAAVTVNVQGAPGKLDAWIDFNADGSWGGPGEQIFDNASVNTGDNALLFDVPSWAVDGDTYARFRLSTAGDLGIGGVATDGEVEDYQVSINPPVLTAGVFSGPNVIDTDGIGAFSVFAVDVDGDGDTDVLSASVSDDKIAWYENDGSKTFTQHTISTSADGAICVFAADVDGDGHMDVLSASLDDDKIAWYENNGSETFTEHTISNTADGALGVYTADVDGDGDLDVLSVSFWDNKIAWYENDGSETFTEHTVSATADGASSVFAADVDGDGDMDVLSASASDDKIAWYENDGSETFTLHTISTTADGAQSVFAADVDGDGDMDVLSASTNDNKIAWYENNGSENFTGRTITTTASGARSVFAADVDGDGDTDVLSASSYDNKIAWYENDGSETFTEHTISTTADGAFSVFAADLDGDADIDVLAALTSDSQLGWYENIAGVDFGDAPFPYATTLIEDGAFHAGDGPRLGGTRDVELDGTHSALADADGADEDGVTFGAIQVGSFDAAVTVNVQGGAGVLDAWLDFNGDGSWGGPGEHVFDNVSVSLGDNALLFDVPSWAASGVTYARFRLSTVGDLAIGGLATDGEVEDYQVSINPPALTAGAFSDQNAINTDGTGAFSVFAVDVDGDGDTDVLSASVSDDKIAWYENDGSETFTQHTISTTADAAWSVFAADVNGDGHMDVLSASRDDDKIAWYENNGSETFTEHTISNMADGALGVFAADVDGDGDLDVLSASFWDNRIAWYENDGSETFTAHTISTSANGASSVFSADVDGDGHMDVLSASVSDDRIAWYENDGSETFTEHTISTTADGAQSVFATDVDGDGDMDVLSASRDDDKIAWYENNGSENFTEHTISTSANGARSVFAADVDGDGDTDVLSASANDNKIAWYENDGGETFTSQTITTTADGAFSVFAADVDGDGDMDVLSAATNDSQLGWYKNLAGFDFGDTPFPYPTTLIEDGALHVNVGPILGTLRDIEADGAHSVAADADGADEDGVTFGAIQVGALEAAVTVNVQNAPTGAKLDVWIDFNGDGSWGGPGEHVFDNVSVNIGDNALLFDVPSWAVDGDTYARFRLSTAGDLGVTGPSADGEVEDYQVSINPPVAASEGFSGQNVISTTAAYPYSVFAADVDGDGDMDVLSASYIDDKIAWYENDGSEAFTQHTISTSANGAGSVFAADVDGDGDMDVLSASYIDDKIAWYENDGSEAFTQHTISTSANGAGSVFAADVDGDGDMDVLSASYIDDKIAWYENDGSEAFTQHTISTSANGAGSVFAADVDGDGDMDVLSASYIDDKIAWYENDGSEAFTQHTISTSANGARSVFAADVDGDGDMDVLSASYVDDKIAWYENDGGETFTSQTITTTADGAFSVFAADVDGDGDMDVLSASYVDDKIAWYENDGSETFTLHTISTTADNARSVFATDVDGDGDMDVLSASLLDNKIAWYENSARFPKTTLVTRDSEAMTPGTLNTLAVTFSEQVDINPSALSLLNTTAGGAAVDLTGVAFDYHAATWTATWDFTGVTDIDAAFYTAVLDATLITNSFGNQLDGDGDGTGGDDFHHVLLVAKKGDTDVDGDIDLSDYTRLAMNFDPSGIYFPHSWCDANFDADFDIDLTDYNSLTASFAPGGYAGTTPALYVASGCDLGGEPSGVEPLAAALPAAALPAATDGDGPETQTLSALRIDLPANALLSTSPKRLLSKSLGANEPNDLRTTITVGRAARQDPVDAAFSQYEHDRQSLGTVASSVTGARSLDLTLAEQLDQRESERVRKLFAE